MKRTILLVWVCTSYAIGETNSKLFSNLPVNSKKEIIQRFANMPNLIPAELDNKTIHYIESYLVRGRKSANIILGRSYLYFPIFEKHFKKYNLPEELKYLAIIESLLNPTIVSGAGAAGLWQLMPRTAQSYGLEINEEIDERFNPNKSTEAAARHLKKQFKRFGNWTLAIAAYNCGGGRMKKAIDKAGSKSYRKVAQYLPLQTQNYIKRFVAATYVMNHYPAHGLQPYLLNHDLEKVDTLSVLQSGHSKEIEKEKNIESRIKMTLNLPYIKEIIPIIRECYNLVLPIVGRKSENEELAFLEKREEIQKIFV